MLTRYLSSISLRNSWAVHRFLPGSLLLLISVQRERVMDRSDEHLCNTGGCPDGLGRKPLVRSCNRGWPSDSQHKSPLLCSVSYRISVATELAEL
jgi:hypothetical protein